VTAETQATLTLRVGDFEGPLDLLLHLCRSQEIDLASLPVRVITDQYVAHLEAMEFRDLESAGAYLVMAATLVYLKSKLLVPAEDGEGDEALDEDAALVKQELEERLREYARVKALGAWLARQEAAQALVWGRPAGELPSAEEIPLEDLSVHLLERALVRLIEDHLLFSTRAGVDRRRSEVVVSLLAVLELVRLGRIRAHQSDLFGEIVIETRPAGEPVAADVDARAH
jgi:segregation and condensation protein A